MQLPPSIQKILDRGVRQLEPQQVLLFGSRARGDAKPSSDFDLAFVGVKNVSAWSDFAAFALYDAATVFGVDVMRYECVPEDLQKSIREDGKILYENV